MRVLVFILVFLLLGAFYIVSYHNLALKNPASFETLLIKYLNWFPKITENIVSVTGHVTKLKWMP